MGNIIELKHIDKIYTGAVDTQVLFDINLSFTDGSCNSIIGESGSGKSTLLNIMSTLDKPTSGEVIIDGVSTHDMGKNKLAELRNQNASLIRGAIRSILEVPKVCVLYAYACFLHANIWHFLLKRSIFCLYGGSNCLRKSPKYTNNPPKSVCNFHFGVL